MSEYILLDYESHDSIPNLGSIFLFIVYLVLLTVLLLAAKLIRIIPSSRLQDLDGKIKQLEGYICSSLIVFLLESSFEFIICGYLNIQRVSFDTLGDILSIVVSVTCFLGCTVWIPYMLTRRVVFIGDEEVSELESEDVQRIIGPAYEGLRVKSRGARAFNLVFMSRRILFMVIIISLREYIGLQIMAMIGLNLFSSAYLASERPFSDKKARRMELFNDVTLLLMSLSLSLFTDYVAHPKI